MIRRASISDALSVFELERNSIECGWTQAQISEAIADEATIFLVSECGYASGKLILDEFNINNVAVKPEFRRCGHGAELMNALLSEATARGATTAFLEVNEGNLAALRLYESLGFKVIGKRPNYYNGSAALNMKKQPL